MPKLDGVKRDLRSSRPQKTENEKEKKNETLASYEPVFSELVTSEAFLEWYEKFIAKFHKIFGNFNYQKAPANAKAEIANRLKNGQKSVKNSVNSGSLKAAARKLDFIYSGYFLFVFTSLALLLVAVIISLSASKVRAQNLTDKIYTSLESSFQSLEAGDTERAVTQAAIAEEGIQELKLETQTWGQDLKYMRMTALGDTKFSAYERMLDASYAMIEAISQVETQLSEIKIVQSQDSALRVNISPAQESLLKSIDLMQKKLNLARADLEASGQKLRGEIADQIGRNITRLDSIDQKLDFTRTMIDRDMSWLIGKNGEKRKVLIIFQNNSELRGGSAGSLGSFGVANFNSGTLQSVDFGKNIYKIDKAFEKANYLEPPDIIKFLRGKNSWTMKDSGWAVDGPESLQKIIELYQKETNESVDGAVVVDTTAMSEFMKVIGPIEMKTYGKTIDATNLRQEIAEEAHLDYWNKDGSAVENEPKKIIGDMIPIFVSRFFEALSKKESVIPLATAFSKNLASKDIFMYFKDEAFQKDLETLNYAAKVEASLGDYLYLNSSNIDGAKSSLSIDEKIALKVEIGPDGTIKNSLNLSRTHNGQDVWPDGLNKNFIRALLPDKASVVKFEPVAGNFQQMATLGLKDGKPYWEGSEAGKKVLNFWMSTKPSETSELNLEYNPGYKLVLGSDFTYNLKVQKQPGANASSLKIEIAFPSEYRPTDYEVKNGKITINTKLDRDLNLKIKFKKR